MQQHGSKYFARRPPPTPPFPSPCGGGVKIQHFQNMVWSCCISNERESQMQQHCKKYFARRPPRPLRVKRLKFNFLCPQRNFGRHIVIAPSVRPSRFCVPSISPIFFDVGIPNLVCGYILGWGSVAYHFGSL